MSIGTEPCPAPASVPALAQGRIVWFTGLSGAGKSTLCRCVAQALGTRAPAVVVLDGDEIRMTLSADLGFSRPDREENMRRLAELVSTHALANAVVLVAAIAPYRQVRDRIRKAAPVPFLEVFVDAPLVVCESRDPKGLYRRARAGTLQQFTGIDDVYEPPLAPEVHCHTGEESVEQSCNKVLAVLGAGLSWHRLPAGAPVLLPAADTRGGDALQLPRAPFR